MQQRFDLHIHSQYSYDCETPLAAIFESARRQGLSGVAIADHDSFSGSEEALGHAPAGLLIIPAVELSTERGHILCYFLKEDPQKAGLRKNAEGFFPFREVCAFAESQGALLFAAHPYRGHRFSETMLPDLCGVEAFNGGNTGRKQRANDQAMTLAERKHLPVSAGSDAHLPWQIGTVARIFDSPAGATLIDLRQALAAPGGRIFGGYSPMTGEALFYAKWHFRRGEYRRALRQCGKAAAGCVLDPLAPLRSDTRCIARGAVFEIGGSI